MSRDIPNLECRPYLLQIQAIDLSLAYDNLHIVLHRQAVFALQSEQPDAPKKEVVSQLLESALRTSNISFYSTTRSICKASHATMHICVYSLTVNVIIYGLLLANICPEKRNELVEDVQRITNLFYSFSGYAYDLADQSLQLKSKAEAV